VVQPYKAKMEDFKKQAIAAGISPDQAKFFLNNDVKILNKLITVLSSFEEDKDINSKHKNLDSDQELNAIEKTNIKEFLDIYKGMGDIEREYLLVNILKPYLSDLKRIQSLERVVERRGWLPIITLTRDEQNKIWNVPHNAAFGKADPASTSDIKEFLKFDLYYDRLVGKKFNVYTVYKNFGPGAALAEEYINNSPDNSFYISRLGTVNFGTQFLQGVATMPEFIVSAKACVIALMGKYRSELSMRLDATMDPRGEETLWVVNNFDEMSRPNTMGLSFPVYVADSYLSPYAAVKNIIESSWTMMTQFFMHETGEDGEYGKYMHKEEYEQIYGLSPMSRNAEDLTLALYGLALGIHIAYNHSMLIGWAKTNSMKVDLTPEKKYASDSYEMMEDLLGIIFNMSPYVSKNVKWNHDFNVAAFWSLKPLVVLTAMSFLLFAVVGYFDPAHSFPVAVAFVALGITLALSIVRNTILLFNMRYGAPWGFFKFIYAQFFNPGLGWGATALHPHYAQAIVKDLLNRLDAFNASSRVSPSTRMSMKDIYQTNKLGAMIAAGVLPLLFFVAPYHPAVWLVSAVLYFMLVLSYIISPHIFNNRKVSYDSSTKWIGPGIGAITSLISIGLHFVVPTMVHSNILILIPILIIQLGIFALGVYQGFKGISTTTGIFSLKNKKAAETLTLFAIGILSMLTLSDNFATTAAMFAPFVAWVLVDFNKRYMAKDIVLGGVYSFVCGLIDLGLYGYKQLNFGLLGLPLALAGFVMGIPLVVVLGVVLTPSAMLLSSWRKGIRHGVMSIKIMNKVEEYLKDPKSQKYDIFTEEELSKRIEEVTKFAIDVSDVRQRRALQRALSIYTHYPHLRFLRGAYYYDFASLVERGSPMALALGLVNESVFEHMVKTHPQEWEEFVEAISFQRDLLAKDKEIELTSLEKNIMLGKYDDSVLKKQHTRENSKKEFLSKTHDSKDEIKQIGKIMISVIPKIQADVLRPGLPKIEKRQDKIKNEIAAWTNHFIWKQVPSTDRAQINPVPALFKLGYEGKTYHTYDAEIALLPQYIPANKPSPEEAAKIEAEATKTAEEGQPQKTAPPVEEASVVSSKSHQLTAQIKSRISSELDAMAKQLDMARDAEIFTQITERTDNALNKIAARLLAHEIDPSVAIRTSDQDSEVTPINKTIKVGIYPIAGDPLTWGHLALALDAIAMVGLDKVVFIAAGDDPRKPTLTPFSIRHPMNIETLGMFEPLFAFSAIAVGTDFDGETNIFRILELNQNQKIEAYYMVGCDHYNRFVTGKDGQQKADTIQKLEDNMANKLYNFNSEQHLVSAIFFGRAIRKQRLKQR